MADVISKASFDPHVDGEFVTQSAGGIFALRLTETRALGPAVREGGAFSLTFLGPLEPFLEQATYRMRHKALGELDIFIVPVERREDGVLYEAVFT